MPKKMTTKEFKDKAKKIFKNKFKYDKTDLDNRDKDGKVIVTCVKHGDFKVTPANHLSGKGCPKCSGKFLTNEERIEIAKRECDTNQYSFEHTNFYRSKYSTVVTCKFHGDFPTSYDNFVNKHCRCPECSATKKLTIEEYEKRANERYSGRYVYHQDYKSMHESITITCPIHGDFKKSAQAHLNGQGCPECSKGRYLLEDEIEAELKKLNIEYIPQVNKQQFEWLNHFSLDFFIPSLNLAIECQGKQHFGQGGWSDKFDFGEQIERDRRKYNLCKDNGIEILYYSNIKPTFEYMTEVYTDIQAMMRIIKDKLNIK